MLDGMRQSEQIKYKSEWFGKLYLEIDRFEPTSKCCNECGWKDVNLCLNDRTFRCGNCGNEVDRDYNAACNIRDCGLKKYLWDARKYTLGDDWRFMP